MSQENLKIRIAINKPTPETEPPQPAQRYNWPLIGITLLSICFLSWLAYSQLFPQAPAQTEERNAPQTHLEAVNKISPKKAEAVISIKAPEAVSQSIAIEIPVKPAAPAPQQEKDKLTPAITIATKSPETIIENKALPAFLKRVQLSTKIVQREPENSLTSPIALSQLPENKLYFFTEIIGKNGQILHHQWRYKKKIMASIPIKIGSPRWRFYSSKHVNKDFLGEWLLEVVDDQDNLLYQQKVHITDQ